MATVGTGDALAAWHELRRSLGNFLAIAGNRVAGRTFTPHPRRQIFIETSGRCNLACRFCAYGKVEPGGFMELERFRKTIDAAADIGFGFVWLTPMLGEVFADPGLDDKFAALDDHPGIEGYAFYSNFILARPPQIESLPSRRKLDAIHVSIYGYDADSFEATTRKPARQFEKLLANLERLAASAPGWSPPGGLHFNVRTKRTATPFLDRDTDLSRLLRRFRTEAGAHLTEADDYDNWGGVIDPGDVEPLGIRLTDGRHIYMHGACTKLFGEVQIKADGVVHACACRDVDGSLVIGDLGERPLRRILSLANPSYRRLIEDQMQGRFGANCRSCSFYRSVYDHRPAAGDPGFEVMSYERALRMLSE